MQSDIIPLFLLPNSLKEETSLLKNSLFALPIPPVNGEAIRPA